MPSLSRNTQWPRSSARTETSATAPGPEEHSSRALVARRVRQAVETLPDGNQNIVYTNHYGEVMLRVYKDVASGNTWKWFTQYDSSGRAILDRVPVAREQEAWLQRGDPLQGVQISGHVPFGIGDHRAASAQDQVPCE